MDGELSDERITVVPYDPEWQGRFDAERARLEQTLAPWLDQGIHHVGSTSIPGIASKPCIDMIAGIRDLEGAKAAFEPLRSRGYLYSPHRSGIAHHFYKPTTRQTERMFGLHLTVPGSDLWRERLAFRDALRNDPSLVAEYQRLKVSLAAEHPNDLHSYTQGKRDFVVGVLGQSGIRLGRR
jgi:GrpB-like predicted nucleotidyltransferase (UPF0157 family)